MKTTANSGTWLASFMVDRANTFRLERFVTIPGFKNLSAKQQTAVLAKLEKLEYDPKYPPQIGEQF